MEYTDKPSDSQGLRPLRSGLDKVTLTLLCGDWIPRNYETMADAIAQAEGKTVNVIARHRKVQREKQESLFARLSEEITGSYVSPYRTPPESDYELCQRIETESTCIELDLLPRKAKRLKTKAQLGRLQITSPNKDYSAHYRALLKVHNLLCALNLPHHVQELEIFFEPQDDKSLDLLLRHATTPRIRVDHMFHFIGEEIRSGPGRLGTNEYLNERVRKRPNGQVDATPRQRVRYKDPDRERDTRWEVKCRRPYLVQHNPKLNLIVDAIIHFPTLARQNLEYRQIDYGKVYADHPITKSLGLTAYGIDGQIYLISKVTGIPASKVRSDYTTKMSMPEIIIPDFGYTPPRYRTVQEKREDFARWCHEIHGRLSRTRIAFNDQPQTRTISGSIISQGIFNDSTEEARNHSAFQTEKENVFFKNPSPYPRLNQTSSFKPQSTKPSSEDHQTVMNFELPAYPNHPPPGYLK